MSRRVFVSAFYNHFQEFLDQLVGMFPEDSDFPAYKTTLSLLQMANPTLAPKEVHVYMKPFQTTIRSRDEKFFLDHSFSEFAQSDAIQQIIGKLKTMWATLSDNNKKCMWDYITLLMDLASRCNDEPSS